MPEGSAGSVFRVRDQSVHNHHRKKIFWRAFLASKRNFPGRWWIQTPYKNTRKTISTTKIFPQSTPIFFCKEKFWTGAGRCMLSFSQRDISTGNQKKKCAPTGWHFWQAAGVVMLEALARPCFRVAKGRTHPSEGEVLEDPITSRIYTRGCT